MCIFVLICIREISSIQNEFTSQTGHILNLVKKVIGYSYYGSCNLKNNCEEKRYFSSQCMMYRSLVKQSEENQVKTSDLERLPNFVDGTLRAEHH